MKYWVIFMCIVLGACSSTKTISDFESFSKQLHRSQKKQKCGFYSDLTYKSRNEIKDRFSFVDFNLKLDTVFILESYNLESGSLYQSVWTKKKKVEYKIQNGQVEIVSNPFITRLYPLIEKWDIFTIKKEEEKYGKLLGSSQMIGARIVIANGHFQMDCIKFQEFFDPKKD
ncbi:hypothetical protein [Leadbetterella sp. DM7]|uniref:hypothetical protein n=1 Tax=Leadbetterella sp. DM7 TaxID=3235085 RepID=UPI00349E7E93